MAENGAFPLRGTGVAELAFGGESGGYMIRRCSLVLPSMARGTLGGSSAETSTVVTLNAFQDVMLPLQTKAGNRFVVPGAGSQRLPRLGCMAVCTLCAQLQSIRVILSSRPMTGLTSLGSSADDSLKMTITTFHASVSAHQGESGVVVSRD